MLKNTNKFKKIIPLQYGLWSVDTKLIIENPEGDQWSFTVKEVENSAEADLEGISLNSLMVRHYLRMIDILKMDIEGAQEEILAKNEEYWIARIKWIIIELHGEKARNVFERAMGKYGFVHKYTNGENEFYRNSNL